MPRLRIQQNVRRLDAGCRHDHSAPVDFDFLLRLAVDVGHASSLTVFVDQDILRQRIGAQFQIVRRLGLRQQEIRSREKCADVATRRAFSAVVARGMSFMRPRKLCAAIRQIWHADFVASSFENPVEAAKVERRQIRSVGIAGPVLHRAGHADHFFDAGVVRTDLVVSDRPVHVVAVERSRVEIDVAEASRTASPEICLAADRFGARPHPLHARRSREWNLVVPRSLGVLVVHVAERFAAPFGIVHAAKFHVPGHAVIAEVLLRIEPLARV